MSLLFDFQVPDYPDTKCWKTTLRWLLHVMDDDDNSLGFIASVYAHYLNRGSLTPKQSKSANAVLNRVWREFDRGILACQARSSEDPAHFAHYTDLRHIEVEGEA